MSRKIANRAMKAFVRQGQPEGILALSITRCQRPPIRNFIDVVIA